LAKRENGRAYLLSKKDHGGDRKSDGYIIESSCQVGNLKNSEMVAKEFGQDDSIPNRTLRISIQLSRLAKLTSLENPKNQYEIEVVSSQLDLLPKMNMDIT